IIWPPNKKPIVLAILSNQGKEDAKYDDKLLPNLPELQHELICLP
ncbi:class A beta-lactamase, partial [Bacillus sp. D-CC]